LVYKTSTSPHTTFRKHSLLWDCLPCQNLSPRKRIVTSPRNSYIELNGGYDFNNGGFDFGIGGGWANTTDGDTALVEEFDWEGAGCSSPTMC
jgi:hypothetical protein